MADLIASLFVLMKGVGRRFLLWLPFILLDSGDYWDRYIQPTLQMPMPENALAILAGAGLLVSAFLTFHELRRDKAVVDGQLVPTVSIDPTPTLQEERPSPDAGTALDQRWYYVTVRNLGRSQICDVAVYLTQISPEVPGLDWLPVSLHIRHDNSSPYKETFTLNPLGDRKINLVSYSSAHQGVKIHHTILGAPSEIPVGTYTMAVRVEGREVRLPAEAKFLVKIDGRKRLLCLPASADEDRKGLLEFHADAKESLDRLPSLLKNVAIQINKIGLIAESLTREIDDAASKPIRWHERLVGISLPSARVRRKSLGWARRIYGGTAELGDCVRAYDLAVDRAIKNLSGYVELAPQITGEDLAGFTNFRNESEASMLSVRALRSAVGSVEQARIVGVVSLSLRNLEGVLASQIKTSERAIEAMDAIIALSEAKCDQLRGL